MGAKIKTLLHHQFSLNFYDNYFRHEWIYDATFLADLLEIKKKWHWNFVSTGPFGAGNFKTLLLLQFLPDLNQTLRGNAFFLTLWNFSMGVNGIIQYVQYLEAVDHRAKGMKIWLTYRPRNCICKLLFMSDFYLFSLGFIRCTYNIADVKSFKRLLLQFWSDFYQTLW